MALITVNLKQIFRHVDATLPKYLIREYGCDAPVGGIYGINPGKLSVIGSPFTPAFLAHMGMSEVTGIQHSVAYLAVQKS